jgi:hypothetical protein
VRALHTDSPGLIFDGEHWDLNLATYLEKLLEVQARWRSALNCWSASSSTSARVLSNWHIIDEGIPLFGATYDSTEHFWQAVKYHPETQITDVLEILERLRAIDWDPWVEALAHDQSVYLEHSYAVEFLRHNLKPERLAWFETQATQHNTDPQVPMRRMQQRVPGTLRFTALEEKILWGDLADIFHLLRFFSRLDNGRFHTSTIEPALESISRHRFDGIYLPEYGATMAFISPEFRQLMFEIWEVKFLEMQRFREVMRSTEGKRLLHFLNGASSPDIPIPIYLEMLEEIRELALQ